MTRFLAVFVLANNTGKNCCYENMPAIIDICKLGELKCLLPEIMILLLLGQGMPV